VRCSISSVALNCGGARRDLEFMQVSEKSAWINGDEVKSEEKRTIVVPDNSVLEVCGLRFAVEHAPDGESTSRDAASDDNEADPPDNDE
jgi:hypothetical protein